MDWTSIAPQYIFLLGVVIVVLTMLRLMVHRIRKNAEKEQQREAAVRVAQAAEHKRQQSAVIPKAKVSSPKMRAPLVDPFSTPFAGSAYGAAAKWEAEVHQIGRQIIGQIDCKMAALQAITQDANRTANRLEILVEHLEQITQATSAKTDATDAPPTVIPVTEPVPEATPLADMLQDLKGISRAIRQSTAFSEQPTPVAILRPKAGDDVPEPTANLRSEVEMLANYGLDPQEIARRLDISLGEVDLMLQSQRNFG
jgi:hypothetical protein